MNSESSSRLFPNTQWTLIQRAASSDERTARLAMEDICKIYRSPVLRLIGRYVRHEQDAEDLTQAFFERMIATNFFATASRPRGRLSNRLWTSAINFIKERHNTDNALKRGGGRPVASLDALHEGNPSAHDPVDDMTPDRMWMRDWARALLADVYRRLEAEHAGCGKARDFALLWSRLPLSTELEKSREEIAAALGIAVGEVSTRTHRLGVKFNESIRAAVRETLDDPTDENVRNAVAEFLDCFRGDPPVFEKSPRNGKSPPPDSVEER